MRSTRVSARGAQAAGALTGLPRELRTMPEYMAGDAKKKAAVRGTWQPLEHLIIMPPDLKG